MSICKGCIGDELGHVPGIVMFAGASDYVLHDWNEDCPEHAPHPLPECGMFDPPRPSVVGDLPDATE